MNWRSVRKSRSSPISWKITSTITRVTWTRTLPTRHTYLCTRKNRTCSSRLQKCLSAPNSLQPAKIYHLAKRSNSLTQRYCPKIASSQCRESITGSMLRLRSKRSARQVSRMSSYLRDSQLLPVFREGCSIFAKLTG